MITSSTMIAFALGLGAYYLYQRYANGQLPNLPNLPNSPDQPSPPSDRLSLLALLLELFIKVKAGEAKLSDREKEMLKALKPLMEEQNK